MRLFAKLTSLIKAVARGPASQPRRPTSGRQPAAPPVDDIAARLDASHDDTKDTAASDRDQTLDHELENERVADLLQRRQVSADGPAQEKGERR
jgi:hypothetical protein